MRVAWTPCPMMTDEPARCPPTIAQATNRKEEEEITTHACIAPNTKGAIRLLSLSLMPGCLPPTLDSLMPMAPASPIPAPARSRLKTQQETVTIFLRQCCSPSVSVTLAEVVSTARSAAKIPMLRIRPIVPWQ